MEEQSKKVLQKMDDFVVIGIGRFGKSIAMELNSMGKEVLAIDLDAHQIKGIEGNVANAVVADTSANGVLYSLGVQNFDCAIVCIGDDLEASILTTLICKDLGVKYVVAKAQNEQHKKVLERIGADMVIFPETFMGKKVAHLLCMPNMNEIMSLNNKFRIVEMAVPELWINKTIGEINIRKKYNVSIIFVKRGEEVIDTEAETLFLEGDSLIVAGETYKLTQISNLKSDAIDVSNSLKDVFNAE